MLEILKGENFIFSIKLNFNFEKLYKNDNKTNST